MHLAAGHAPDAGDEPGARRLVVVHVRGRERGELEERRSGIEQPVDPLAHRQLALLAVALQVFRPPPPRRARRACVAQLARQARCIRSWLARNSGLWIDGVEGVHSRQCRIDDATSSDPGLPAAAVGLEPAGGTAPDRVHPVHLCAAAVAEHRVVVRADVGDRGLTGTGSAGGRRIGHGRDYSVSARQRPIRTIRLDSAYQLSNDCRYPGHDLADLYNLKGLLHRKLSFVMSHVWEAPDDQQEEIPGAGDRRRAGDDRVAQDPARARRATRCGPR